MCSLDTHSVVVPNPDVTPAILRPGNDKIPGNLSSMVCVSSHILAFNFRD